ncbi:MAG: tetratricopeptide repeat protein, partial [Gemmatimonadales bacterium]
DAWVTAERARLDGLARDAIEAVAREADGTDPPLAATRWQRLIELDPLTTRYALGYARALARIAETGNAVRHLRQHSSALRSELGVPAPAEVSALIAELTRRTPAEGSASETDGDDAPARPSPSGDAGPIGATVPPSAVAPTPSRGPVPTWRRLPTLALVGAAVLSLGWFWWSGRPARTVTGGGMIVLADIENLTGDSTLGPPLAVAFRVGIEQAENISVYPRDRLGSSLARMGRTITDTVLTETLARDIALRESGQAVITVTIAELGGRYTLSARIVDPPSGRGLAARRVDVAGDAELLGATDKLATWIRRKLGDIRPDAGAPLPLVTTASLPALKTFVAGVSALGAGDAQRGRALLEHAIELDTGFAVARATLGSHYLDRNRIPEALRWLREADARSGRLSEPERLEVKARLAFAEGRTAAAIENAGTLATRYPSARNWSYYGEALRTARRYQEAVAAFEQAIALDTSGVEPRHGLALAEKGLGNYREALDAYTEVDRRDPNFLMTAFLNQQWGETYVRIGDLAAAESVFRRMLGRPLKEDRARGFRALAYLAIYQGRFRSASESLRQAIPLQAPGELSEFRDQLVLADVSRTRGDARAATAALDRAYVIFRSYPIQAAAVMLGGHQFILAGQLGRAGTLLDSLEARAALRPDSRQDQSALGILQADLALARGRPAEAGRLLEDLPLETYGVLVAQLRAEAHTALGHPDSAAAAARKATELLQFGLETQLDWHRSFATLAQAAEASGDMATAREAWSSLIERWKDGDADLPPLVTARRELARLQSGVRR